MKSARLFWVNIIERVFGFLVVILLGPMLLLVAVMIHITSGGPILVTDEVAERDGTVAHSYRFRTSGRGSSNYHTIGRVLRRYSIDESAAFLSLAHGDIRLSEILKFLRR